MTAIIAFFASSAIGRFILAIPARFKLWAAAIGAALVAVLAIYAKGRASANAKHELKAARSYRTTTEKVLHETTSADPVSDIRKRMRDRAGKP